MYRRITLILRRTTAAKRRLRFPTAISAPAAPIEEAYDFDEQHGLEGNFLNGLYEQEHVRYGEWNFGFPTESQTILNVPNCKTIRLVVDGEPMDIRTGTLQNYRRTLDMKRGQVVRSFEWTAPNGKTVRVENTRFVSLTHKNRMAQRYSVPRELQRHTERSARWTPMWKTTPVPQTRWWTTARLGVICCPMH